MQVFPKVRSEIHTQGSGPYVGKCGKSKHPYRNRASDSMLRILVGSCLHSGKRFGRFFLEVSNPLFAASEPEFAADYPKWDAEGVYGDLGRYEEYIGVIQDIYGSSLGLQ